MAKSKLTKAEVLHIAKLSNLTLSEAEVTKFQRQLSEVLRFVESLSSVYTKDTQPTSQVTGLTNVKRVDKPGPCLTREEALSGAKKTKANYFTAKALKG